MFIQVDKTKAICINNDGRLLMNGTRPVTPDVDPETELKTFEVSSASPHGGKEKRYLHIEVLRHFGPHGEIPKGLLEPEDVEFLDEKLANPYVVGNLQLSESGREKVHQGTSNAEQGTPNDEVPQSDEEVHAEAAEDAQSEKGDDVSQDEEVESSTSLQSSPSQGEEVSEAEDTEDVGDEAVDEAVDEVITDSDDGADESASGDAEAEDLTAEDAEDAQSVEEPAKFFVAELRGSRYDVKDPATDESILEEFGEDKLLAGGKAGVEKWAEEQCIEVRFD